MKKSLVLAMAMALGVTVSAHAANPFSDVPAGHWAYDSVAKLAAAGVVDGYPDGTFRGDRLMTRYEMAQIVAKAMAKGANVDRLAAEFADELDALGVRVSALEKKSDNVKITGEIRGHFVRSKNFKAFADDTKKEESGLRSRLYVNGSINNNWDYVGRIENQQYFTNNTGDEEIAFPVAYVTGRLGGMDVTAGRQDDSIADGYIYDGGFSAVNASYGDKYVLSGFYGRPDDDNCQKLGYTRFWGAELATNTDSAVDAKVGYVKFENLKDKTNAKAVDTWGLKKAKDVKDGNGIWYAGADFKLGEDVVVNGMYLKSDVETNFKDDGYVAGLEIKGAEAAEPGSWGLYANYYRQGAPTIVAHTIDGKWDFAGGFKGYRVGGNVALAKNVVLDVAYYDTKAIEKKLNEGEEKDKVIYSELTFTF